MVWGGEIDLVRGGGIDLGCGGEVDVGCGVGMDCGGLGLVGPGRAKRSGFKSKPKLNPPIPRQ